MPDPSAMNRVIQIGPETTAGTAVATTRKLSSLGLEMAPEGAFQRVKPTGRRYATQSILNKKWATYNVAGALNLQEAPIWLTSLFGKTTPTGTTLKTWAFNGLSGVAIDPQTYTLENSDGSRAEKAAFLVFAGMTLNVNREEVTLSGSAISRDPTLGATPTAGNTQIEDYVVGANDWNIYYDGSSGAVGTTQLLKVISCSWEMPDIWAPSWYLNRAIGSFSNVVEQGMDPQIRLTVAWDTVAEGIHADVVAGTTKWLQFHAQHTYASQTMHFIVNAAVKGAGFNPFSDEDGRYAMEFVFDMAEDSGWAKAQSISVANTLAAV